MLLRRRLVTACAASLALPSLASPRRALPAMTDGPFYPPPNWRARWPNPNADWDADLTQVSGQAAPARGEHLALSLRLADTDGRAIDRAEVEIWQCDALAMYRHPRVPAEPGRFDAGFQGFGSGRSGRDGELRFRTIRPVAYPGRTPHIHIKLRHPSFGEQTSQLFVRGEAGNAHDFLWRQLDAEAQDALAMQLEPANTDGLRWQARHAIAVPV